MKKENIAIVSALFGIALSAIPSSSVAKNTNSAVERGRYLVKIAGCNDCHTFGYTAAAGKVPEEKWLTGDNFGWRGDWGTTYATNLRINMQGLTEAQWLAYAKSIKTRPPMPWFMLNEMKEEDLKAIYQFVRYLGPAGNPSESFVPPDQEPKPPFAIFPPAPPKQ
jgi:mono/diheme cytochrome c family protein